MAGLLLCIIAIIIGFSYPEQSEPGHFSLSVTLSATLLFAVACGLAGLLSSIRLKHGLQKDSNRRLAIEQYVLLKKLSWFAVLALYGACVHWFDFPYLVYGERYLGLSDIPLVDSLVVLLPFFIYAMANLAGLYYGDKRLRGSSWSIFAYEAFYLRQFAIPVFPFLAFTTAFDLITYMPAVEEKIYVYRWLLTIGYALFIIVLFSLAPMLFKLLWNTRRLPESSLRDKVEKIAAANGVKFRDIIIWRTGGSNIANAMVTGLLGSLRYIFVTDALLALLPEDEVVAVLAHEMGHARHKHMQIYLLLAVSFIAFISTVEQQLPEFMNIVASNFPISIEFLYILYAFGIIILFWGVIFGFSSRRFEQEADMFAAKLVSPQTFGSALSRIAILSGGPRTFSSWRHFSIDKRVDFMERVAAGEETAKFRRNLRAALSVVAIVTVFGLSAFAYEIYDSSNPKTRYERQIIYDYLKEDYIESIKTADKAISEFPLWADAYYYKAGSLDELGRLEDAVDMLEKAIEIEEHDIFYYQLSEIFIKMKKYQRAMWALSKAVELAPGNEIYQEKLEYLTELLKAEMKRNGQLPGNGHPASE